MNVPTYSVSLVRDGNLQVSAETITTPETAAEIIRQLIGPSDREVCVVLLLNARHAPIGVHVVSIGSVSASLVHPREVLKAAILASASAFLLAHNHPSNDPMPSTQDHALTQRMIQAGELIGILCQDHVIVSERDFFSFRQHQPEWWDAKSPDTHI